MTSRSSIKRQRHAKTHHHKHGSRDMEVCISDSEHVSHGRCPRLRHHKALSGTVGPRRFRHGPEYNCGLSFTGEGGSIYDHDVHHIAVPDDITVDNGTGGPRSIDPSWNLCHGYFFIKGAPPLEDSAENCTDFLSEECMDEMKTSLQEGIQANDSCRYPVKLPESCRRGELMLLRGMFYPKCYRAGPRVA